MHRFMIVANQTLGGDHIRREVAKRVAEGRCQFYLVVPATPYAPHGLVWTEGESRAVAHRRLEETLQRLRLIGADVEGEVGDQWPLTAITDVLLTRDFDEIIISTLPSGVSRWLSLGLPRRVERVFNLPVTLITADRDQVAVVDQPAGVTKRVSPRWPSPAAAWRRGALGNSGGRPLG
jgi:hypothetical protein